MQKHSSHRTKEVNQWRCCTLCQESHSTASEVCQLIYRNNNWFKTIVQMMKRRSWAVVVKWFSKTKWPSEIRCSERYTIMSYWWIISKYHLRTYFNIKRYNKAVQYYLPAACNWHWRNRYFFDRNDREENRYCIGSTRSKIIHTVARTVGKVDNVTLMNFVSGMGFVYTPIFMYPGYNYTAVLMVAYTYVLATQFLFNWPELKFAIFLGWKKIE